MTLATRKSLASLGQNVLPALLAAAAMLACAASACALEPGFRQLDGRHLTLITDVSAKEDLDDLPKTFDAAFPLWCRYFGLDAAKLADWHVTGYLMKSREHFEQAGYWQADLPPFPNGFSAGEKFWLYDQASPYYRRHLLLHEGVHSFMFLLVGQGPPGYMEGMAELLATHHWQDGQLEVGYFPAAAAEVQQLGRIEIIQNALAAGHRRGLHDVLTMRGLTVIDNDVYGWSWGLAAFLDGHPRYRERFRSLHEQLRATDFDVELRRQFGADLDQLSAEWQAFAAAVDYGYDFDRMSIDFRPGQPLVAGEGRATLDVDRGWQSSQLRVEAGKTYELSAKGRYQIAREPAVWWCEPGGVTIRYYRGQPLGILLGVVDADRPLAAPKPAASAPDEPPADSLPAGSWARPIVIGLGTTFTPATSGTLYVRINESAGELADNSGAVELVVREVPAKP
ncbi:MAG TPA: hypothetical protein VHY91_09650 [Pirellulales bacterium]|jgi:hypothetical protein|nr:hypothetical protein [Pirellulales bacterium]